ncbi:MAG: MBL fold metallo-hydrolase, partial [Myxococcota bacterium]
MHWTALGHAMWLAEAAGLRLLFDPLLSPTHHGGVFEIVGRPTIVTAALRPDFVFVSHRHPDHFNVPSLAALAAADPHSVVVTPDALVAWAAETLGFKTVQRVPAAQRVDLDGVTVVTTPSVDPREWGAMVACEGAVVWNQVDTVLDGAAEVRRVVAAALSALGEARVDLALVRWQPMLEIAAPLGHATQFPFRGYERLLDEIATVDAGAVVPSACGGRHTTRCAWLDQHVFPLSVERFVRDLRARVERRVVRADPGTRIAVQPGEVSVVRTESPDLVRFDAPGADPRAFRPTSVPPLVDDNLDGVDEATLRRDVQAWVEGPLANALASVGDGAALRFSVSVVFPSATDDYTIAVEAGGSQCARRHDPEWDCLNEVAGSLLWDVLQGRRHWGDLLLSGALRARSRAYRVEDRC